MKFITKHLTVTEYDSVKDGLATPHVAYIEETDGYEYEPYVPSAPNNIITYKASAALAETTSTSSSGLHTNAFSGASGQLTKTSHTFENGVGTIVFDGDITSVGSYAFAGASITNIMLPNRVESIGSGAFFGCIGLESITCRAMTAPTCYTETFRDVKTGGTLYVPQGSSGYDSWMSTSNYYLGRYEWRKVEQ